MSNHVLMMVIQPAAWSLYYDYNPSALGDRHSHAQSRVTKAPWTSLKIWVQPEGFVPRGPRLSARLRLMRLHFDHDFPRLYDSYRVTLNKPARDSSQEARSAQLRA